MTNEVHKIMKLSKEKSKELSNWFRGFLWIMIMLYAGSIVYTLVTINQIQFLGAGIASIFLQITFIIGAYLMNKARKEGFYLVIGSWIIQTLCCVIAYGFLNYHVVLMGDSLSTSASWRIAVLSVLFWLLLLLGFMSIKKNGKNAFKVLWSKG